MEEFGFLFINKPKGLTSHDVIDKLRVLTKIKKIGHAGTLDPFATGLLIVGVGRRATKKLSKFLHQEKEYEATLKLGFVSTTFDPEGEISFKSKKRPTLKEIEKILTKFKGKIKQIPPIFSAKKIKGKKLYEFARRGIKIKPKPSEVEIYKIKIVDYHYPFLKLKINCSPGTYIRSLASDIGRALSTGAYLLDLKRTKIGKINLKEAIDLEKLNSENWKKFLKWKSK